MCSRGRHRPEVMELLRMGTFFLCTTVSRILTAEIPAFLRPKILSTFIMSAGVVQNPDVLKWLRMGIVFRYTSVLPQPSRPHSWRLLAVRTNEAFDVGRGESGVDPLICLFLVALCCCKKRLYLSLWAIICPVIHDRKHLPPPPPPQKHDFWAAPAILSKFCFWKKNLNFFFTYKKIFPLSLFYAFLDISCHPECSKNFHPKFLFPQNFSAISYMGEARRDSMLPSILVFSRFWDSEDSSCICFSVNTKLFGPKKSLRLRCSRHRKYVLKLQGAKSIPFPFTCKHCLPGIKTVHAPT